MRGTPNPMIFFETSPIKTNGPHGAPPLKNEALQLQIPPATEELSPLPGNDSYKKTLKNWKLSLIFMFQSQNNTEKRWQKFHKNVIFSIGAFKIL